MSKSVMTKGKWEIDDCGGELHIITEFGLFAIASLVCDPMDEETKANASAIVLAVNNTYGAGINPEAVADLVDALKVMCEYWEWTIKDPDFHAYIVAKAAIEKAKL